MGWYGGMGFAAWMGMGLFWIVLLGLVVWLVVRSTSASSTSRPDVQRPAAPPRETPEEILDRRFARGELDIETYEAQRAALARARSGSR